MSTKIHNGYRVRGGDAFAVAARLADTLQVSYRDLYLTMVARTAALYADRLLSGAPLPDDAPVAGTSSPWIMATLHAEQTLADIVRTGRRNPFYDLQCEVTFLADPDQPGDMYALVYTEQSAYLQVWESFDGVEPWPYWNNADRPDDVDDLEWECRRDTWNRLIGDSAPAQRGLTWSFLGRMHHVETVPADLVAHLPDRLARARMLAPALLTLEPGAVASGASTLMVELMSRTEQLAADLEGSLPELTAETLTHVAVRE